MGLLDRVWRAAKANLNSMVGASEDPEQVLTQTLEEMQTNLIQLRQAVAQAIATQKRTERQLSHAESNAREWYNRAQLAVQKGEESVAREALTRRKTYLDSAQVMSSQIEQQRQVVTQLKENMRLLEGKLAEAKTKKDMYIARARSAEASQRLQEMLYQVRGSGAIASFERMEEKVLDLEARADAMAELSAPDTLEQQFAALEGSANNSVEAELSAMKARFQGQNQPEALPPDN